MQHFSISMLGTFVTFNIHCWNFVDNSAGSFLSQSLPSLQSCWNITFNSNMDGDNMPKGLNTDIENCKNCLFVMCLCRISCNRCWMVKLKVSLLMFHGIPSTFVSSTRLGFNDESAHDCSSFLFIFLNECHKLISIAFPFSKIYICFLKNQLKLNIKLWYSFQLLCSTWQIIYI